MLQNLNRQYIKEIEVFKKSSDYLDPFKQFMDLNYWKEDEYEITISWLSDDNKVKTIGTYKFSLTKDDAKRIDPNSSTILQVPINDFLQLQNPIYQKRYLPNSKKS